MRVQTTSGVSPEGHRVQGPTSMDGRLRTIAGQPVDRIPIRPPLVMHASGLDPEPDHWRAQPNYRQLMLLFIEHCSPFVEPTIPERRGRRQVRRLARPETAPVARRR